jgi:L-threonylcarbamoyladenylate synthase
MAEIGTDLNKAKRLLEEGNLVAIPTETVYGLAGNALDNAAVARIFAVKERPFFDPLIVHVPSLERAHDYAREIPDAGVKLARRFWPGPLTLVVLKSVRIPDLVTSGQQTVGLRSPDHALTRRLLDRLDFPLAAPSANPFGYVSPTEAAHVSDQLGDRIPYILDGGPCRIGIESTIVGFEDGRVVIYRTGGIGVEAIEQVVGSARVRDQEDANLQVPGQLKSHYAPRKKVILGSIPQLLQEYRHSRVAILSFATAYAGVPPEHQFILSPSANLEEAAQRLFFALRMLDKLEIEVILTEEVPAHGLGRAINDRLRRAAATVG